MLRTEDLVAGYQEGIDVIAGVTLDAGERAIRLVAGVAVGAVALRLLSSADAAGPITLGGLLLLAGLGFAVTGAAGRALLFGRGPKAVSEPVTTSSEGS